MGERRPLTRLEVKRTLARTTDLRVVKEVRDKAEAMRQYIRNAHQNLAEQNIAAEAKLRAERRAGELLAALKLRGGRRKSNSIDTSLNLRELCITWDQSARWQKLAAITEAVFEDYLQATTKLGREITEAGLLRHASAHGCGGARSPRSKRHGEATRSKGSWRESVTNSSGDLVSALRSASAELQEAVRLLANLLLAEGQLRGDLRPAELRALPRLLASVEEQVRDIAALLNQLPR
jgi:hypothetical protein